jgi:integrase
LSPAAIELIGKLMGKRGADDSEFVFPGRVAGKPIRELRRVRTAVTARAGLKGALVYTLRHSYASIGAGGGLSLQIIGKLLGHTVARTTERYAHLSDDPLRDAAAKIGGVIANAGKAASNGAEFPKRGGAA